MIKSYLSFLLLACWMACSCQVDTPTDPPIGMEEKEPENPTDTLSYLALGDSYTIGQSVQITNRWPTQLVAALNEDSVYVQEPYYIARTGWTTTELKEAIEVNSGLADTYDMVSLLIGVNNQYRGYNIKRYEAEFRELLQTAIKRADDQSERVFVLSIPDYGATPFGQASDPDKIGQELDAYNEIAKGICEQFEVDFYDITPISREGLNDPELVASDGLHPSGKMYTQWVELILPGIEEMLKK